MIYGGEHWYGRNKSLLPPPLLSALLQASLGERDERGARDEREEKWDEREAKGGTGEISSLL